MKSTAWLEGCQAPCAGQQLGERTGGLPEWCSGRRRRVADLLDVGSGPLLDHLVDKAEILGHLRGEEGVALERVLDLLERLAGMLHVDLVEALLEAQNLLGVEHDVGCLAL